MAHDPSVTPLVAVEAALSGTPPGSIRVSRLVTRERQGSGLLFGVLQMEVGASAAWSFEDSDPHMIGIRYWGPVDETYYVLKGRIRVEWESGESLVCGPEEAVHFAPGHRYVCTNIGQDVVVAVYAMAPAAF